MTGDGPAHRRRDAPPQRAPAGDGAVSGLRLLIGYRRHWAAADLVAGLTVGAMLVPQSMAYAELAGLPPQTGLYAALLAPVAYALVGTSRHLGTGPEPGTAILAATGVGAVAGTGDPARTMVLMAALAVLVAGVAAGAWLLRLGYVANLLSKPVLVGYITGVGLVLISSQLEGFTGIPVDADRFFPRLVELATGFGDVNWVVVALAAATLAVLVALRRWLPQAPGVLVAVVLTTTASVLLDLEAIGSPTVDAIPPGLPTPGWPDVALGDFVSLVPVALGVALVGFSDNMLTGRSIADRWGYRLDAGRELAGLAAANLAAGLAQGMPVSSSASRTAVAATLGGVTSLVSVLASAVVAVTVLFAHGVLAEIPTATLAAIIVAAGVAIIDVGGFRRLWGVSRAEFALAVTTTLTVMVFDVLIGVLVAVTLSVLVALSRLALPEDSLLGSHADLDGWIDLDQHPDARTVPGLLVYRFDAPLIFLNVERFRSRLTELLERNPGAEEWVVLDCEGVGAIDATALDGLSDLIADLRARGVRVVAVARANERTTNRLARAGLLGPAGPLAHYATINAAVRAFQQRPPG